MKRSLIVFSAGLVFLGFLFPVQGFAQVPPLIAGGKHLEIVRTDTPPRIDGIVEEAEWAGAAFFDDLHQLRPTEYAEPSERTEMWLMYDDDFIYIAAIMYIAPENITANFLRRGGNVLIDDNIIFNFGPFNDQRSGYYFGVNPNGVRVDGIFQNVTDPYNDWDTIFYVETSRFEHGWMAEFAIPFKSLSFNPNNSTWGFNVTRSIQSRDEMLAWQSFDRRFDPSSFGQMTGMTGMNQGLGLDVTPALSINTRRAYSPVGHDTDIDPSLDLVYKITNSLNGSLTINTDFSGTEVDNRQVNLTRFGLFFPEKRSFFLSEADIFQFGRIGSNNNVARGQNGRPFFSRNIGLSRSGQEVDINYGGKISGRIGSLDVGALSIRQDEQPGVDATTLSVVRASHGILNESTLGFIYTQGNPHSNLDNSLLGLDLLYRNSELPGGRSMEISSWYQQSDTEGVSGDESAYGLGFFMPTSRGWGGGVARSRFEGNFNPALGFVNRRGVEDTAGEITYSHLFRDSLLQRYRFIMAARRYELINTGDLQSQSIALTPFELTSRTNDVLFWRTNLLKEVLQVPFEISPGVIIPQGSYSYHNHGVELRTARFREHSMNFTYIRGSFYTGDQDRFFGEFEWQPSARFRASIGYDINFIDLPEGKFTTRIYNAGIDYVFTNRLSLLNIIQYDNVSNILGFNSRLHWVPEEGQEYYFVINHLMNEQNSSFSSMQTDLTVKLGYTFRY